MWHNVPKLKEFVILDPQWLADSMAGVVSFIFQSSVSNMRGMLDKEKLMSSLQLKFVIPAYTLISLTSHRVPQTEMHSIAIEMLEFFEIVYRMKGQQLANSGQVRVEQMFFVPSLLSPYEQGVGHPSLTYWYSMESRYVPNSAFIFSLLLS